jgi:hypothetical protein
MTVDILNAPQFAEATFAPKRLNGPIAATFLLRVNKDVDMEIILVSQLAASSPR